MSSYVLFFLQILVKSTALLALASLAALLLRRRSAALRHHVWSVALGCLLALPLFMSVLPAWSLPLNADFLSSVFLIRSQAVAYQTTQAGEAFSLAGILVNPQGWNGSLLAALWAIGVAASFIQMLIGWIAVERLHRRATPLTLPEFQPLAHSLGLNQKISLLQSPPRSMPITFGVTRPTVILPSDFQTWDQDCRRAVLLHELAHVQRRDSAVQILARLALAFYWWHPLAWFAWREFLKERERAADDLVLNSGSAATEYAGHLLDIARSMSVHRLSQNTAVAMARPHQLEARLSAILDSNRVRSVPTRMSLLITLAAALCVTVPWATVQAKDKAPSVYRIGGDVKPPVLINKIEPNYSEEARRAHYSGTDVLQIEIGVDGHVHKASVLRPLGFGLDEQAVAAVKKWKFSPATKHGHPVPVVAKVEVNFRIE